MIRECQGEKDCVTLTYSDADGVIWHSRVRRSVEPISSRTTPAHALWTTVDTEEVEADTVEDLCKELQDLKLEPFYTT